MRKYLIKFSLVLLVLSAFNASAADISDVTIVEFSEKENDASPYPVRFLFSKQLLRIDDGNNDGDYVLYDDSTRNIYSVNHEDQTILAIVFEQWEMPEFKFKRHISWKKMDNAPLIDGKPISHFWLVADEKICVDAQIAEGFLNAESQMMQRYKTSLSSGQVKSIVATPEEMQTPCLLADQVYNDGSLFLKGFPVQQWHITGLQRLMTGFKKQQTVADQLFQLPINYKKYSMGDDLTLGKPE